MPKSEWQAAYDALDADLRAALETSAERVRDFHARQPIPNWTTDAMGGTLGQRLVPLERVGIYVPGGTAPLPSSLLMAAIPARVAGVDEVIVCTPADRQTGRMSPLTLAAAHIAGVDRRLRARRRAGDRGDGLWHGECAPRGQGRRRGRAVHDRCEAPGLSASWASMGCTGPTETVVVADDSANPAWVAADLLAQAEHDVLATAILLTPVAGAGGGSAGRGRRSRWRG